MGTRDQICTECGKTFRSGGNTRCSACRATERTCTECGKTFKGSERACPACRVTSRVCTSCGRVFTGNQARCQACRIPERVCEGCGRDFKGTHRHCPVCKAAGRVCECGRPFKGTHRHCAVCRATGRVCECGRPFKGNERSCAACRATERTCEGCGQQFTSHQRYCASCRVAALPPGERAARARQKNNNRRARQVVAEVAGPVSRTVYATVVASGPCVYCGSPATEVDHVRPLARGGWEHESNLVPACKSCNSGKHDRLLTEWRPDRVARAVAVSPAVAAEWARLTGLATA